MADRWLWPNSAISRVIDGDSFDASVTRDLGFGGSATFKVKLRLARVNAMPAKTDAGRLATARVRELVGAPVLLETARTYKYGGGDVPEWMAEITLPDGQNLSDLLVKENLAVYWNGEGPRPDTAL